jgi:hypothetical protein
MVGIKDIVVPEQFWHKLLLLLFFVLSNNFGKIIKNICAKILIKSKVQLSGSHSLDTLIRLFHKLKKKKRKMFIIIIFI